ncbi:hypothetical protein Lalb_Chr06g0168021 [Lupinus albus]|uniref:Uncharacterized protein n=1 Tax=Lupinus albus TaxID=3870 RepID=A0A6A4QDF2_LUPAL|nr:hypothetical protein Lalb_Chr06g0168021 [Lupinus albus]
MHFFYTRDSLNSLVLLSRLGIFMHFKQTLGELNLRIHQPEKTGLMVQQI